MRLTRVYVAAELVESARLALDARAAGHLLRVLRLGVGAALTVFDGRGREHLATIIVAQAARVEVAVGRAREPLPESRLAITLAQGVSRSERMDYAIQKATELGVTGIQPLLCERSVVRLDADQAARRLAHWRLVAIAACEQCGRARLPEIAAPLPLPEWLRAGGPVASPGQLLALLSPAGERRFAELPAVLERAVLLIGPEGGLAEAEERLARECGYGAFALGPRVLRTETAATAAIAVLQALRGDLG